MELTQREKYDDKNPVGDNDAAKKRRLQDTGYTICDHCGGPIELFRDMRREFDGRLYWAHIGQTPDHLARPNPEVR